MASVAPEPQTMKVCPDELAPQPKRVGNGCPCECCGKGPKEITVENIKKHSSGGQKWIQKPDGRVIEYYVYGSEEPDAKIFIQLCGDMSSASTFPQFTSFIKILKEKNVKAISPNFPGIGFTSVDPHRRIGDWAKSDVDPVLKAEGVPDDAPLMIEGTSFGSLHCYSLMWYYQDRVTHAHFQVPTLAKDLAAELKLSTSIMGLDCTGKYSTTCFLVPCYWCSPVAHCCCCCILSQAGSGEKELTKLPDYDSIKADGHDFEAWEVMSNGAKHCVANGFQGQMYNFYKKQMYENWGFHPFNDIKLDNVQKMKIMISYGEKDTTSPENHGEYMAKFYSEKCNKDGQMFKNVEPKEVVGNDMGGKCLVNYGAPPKGYSGHEAHFIAFFKGELLQKLLDL
jgi:pimeloyl-ACP methyl ester carboxylesterase